MADVQLFTSIPPRISRTNAEDEIGESYQADCIASWIDAGFAPTTINARAEGVDLGAQVRKVRVERDASEITGKPHPYFGDVLAAITQQTNGPFVLVNADILIPSRTGLAKRVASLGPGEMLIGRRLDVAQLGEPGTPYFYGYDFFAAHSEDVAPVTPTNLIFGAPWWDHFFPLAMHLHGSQVTQLEPQVIHLHHHERWNLTTYRTLGDRFIAEIRPMVGNGTYARRLERIVRSAADGRRHWLRRPDPDEEQLRHLGRLDDLNLAVLDHIAPPPPRSGVRIPLKLRLLAKLLRLNAASEIFSST